MHFAETLRALAELTDPGLFELLATAVLRSARPDLYANLTQPGINADGKTARSPVDGLAFISNADPPHLVVAHHTITSSAKLRNKWLKEDSSINKKQKAVFEIGDLIKTSQIVEQARESNPALQATLALTTNGEPSADLTIDTILAGQRLEIGIDIWSRSRIADYLDNDPKGQWIRNKYLNITQQRISLELLKTLTKTSFDSQKPFASDEGMVERPLLSFITKPVSFLVGDSGFGKTTTCFQHLKKHIESGGCGLVLPHELLSTAFTLDQAIDGALRQLHPELLAGCGVEARALCAPEKPLVLIVEDINKSGCISTIVERLVKWSEADSSAENQSKLAWQLICPVWPQHLLSLGEETKTKVEALSIVFSQYTPEEAQKAIQQRAVFAGINFHFLNLKSIAENLSNDPLLIALHDLNAKPDASTVVNRFIISSTERLASGAGTFTAVDYQNALLDLGLKMLINRDIEPKWTVASQWLSGMGDDMRLIRELMKHGEIIRINKKNGDTIGFRHDRVQLRILINSAIFALEKNTLQDEVFSEPYYAEIMGNALSEADLSDSCALRARELAPLSLFYALQAFQEPQSSIHHAAIKEIDNWISDGRFQSKCNESTRRAALQVLSQTESTMVLGIVNRFTDEIWPLCFAKFRYGNVLAGMWLCFKIGPGLNAPWRDIQIEYACSRHKGSIIDTLNQKLKSPQISDEYRIGALRLAGHIGDLQLVDALLECWVNDTTRIDKLADYIWMAAQCGEDKTAMLLEPMCNAWGTLPAEETSDSAMSRNALAANGLRFAFSRKISEPALKFFIQRANREDLRWPITYMLSEVDHPLAIEFMVSEMARVEAEGQLFWHFTSVAADHWKRQQELDGTPMSDLSRMYLADLFHDSQKNEFLRKASFKLWAATFGIDDIQIMNAFQSPGFLDDEILRARLDRKDSSAIPALIEKLRSEGGVYWWQECRHLWSDELTFALDRELSKRGACKSETIGSHDYDSILSELLMRLNPHVAEGLLIKHWSHLQLSAYFVQSALYHSTKKLRDLVHSVVAGSEDPASLFEHIDSHFGVMTTGHPGVRNLDQLIGLTPYLDHVKEGAIHRFWDHCNRSGWIEFRRTHLDSRLGSWREKVGLDDNVAVSELNDELLKDTFYWMDHWVEKHQRNGRSTENILNLVYEWLRQNKTNRALTIASSIIMSVGSRKHVAFLVKGSDGSLEANDIINDTRFYIYHRTLS